MKYLNACHTLSIHPQRPSHIPCCTFWKGFSLTKNVLLLNPEKTELIVLESQSLTDSCPGQHNSNSHSHSQKPWSVILLRHMWSKLVGLPNFIWEILQKLETSCLQAMLKNLSMHLFLLDWIIVTLRTHHSWAEIFTMASHWVQN